MSTNRVPPDAAENNRYSGGRYTFNAFPDDDYEGRTIVIAALRIGDHAHLQLWTGVQVARVSAYADPILHRGHAGYLTLAWEDWRAMRDQLVTFPNYRIAEVENPTNGQIAEHTP